MKRPHIWARKPALREKLASMWASGLTPKAIAAALTIEAGAEITANAVLGKVHRMQLPMRRPCQAGWSGKEPQRRPA